MEPGHNHLCAKTLKGNEVSSTYWQWRYHLILITSVCSRSAVRYQSQSSYELQGNRNLIGRNGERSEPPKCLDACRISEEIMEKHNIQLRWLYQKKIYSKTDDTVEFVCKHGYRIKSPLHTFRVTCQEGKLIYPTCVKKWWLNHSHIFCTFIQIFHYWSNYCLFFQVPLNSFLFINQICFKCYVDDVIIIWKINESLFESTSLKTGKPKCYASYS